MSICLNLFWFRDSACFAHDKTAINQRRVEKSAFEDQSEENSVKKADTHLSAALLLLLRCNWCQNLAAVTCILH